VSSGGVFPTIETPASSIVIAAPRAHDGGMRSLLTPLLDTLLDPAVLVGAALAIMALLSGLVARVHEIVQDRRPLPRSTR
jgi:hypothetical protein